MLATRNTPAPSACNSRQVLLRYYFCGVSVLGVAPSLLEIVERAAASLSSAALCLVLTEQLSCFVAPQYFASHNAGIRIRTYSKMSTAPEADQSDSKVQSSCIGADAKSAIECDDAVVEPQNIIVVYPFPFVVGIRLDAAAEGL